MTRAQWLAALGCQPFFFGSFSAVLQFAIALASKIEIKINLRHPDASRLQQRGESLP
jgi:hypothetical protein